MKNTVDPKPHKAVEVLPHDEGCGARFEIRGFEMLTCNAAPLGWGPNDTLYLWHILECSRFGCDYRAFVRDDYVFRLLVGIETPLVDNAEIWLRDTLAQAEKFLAEAESERHASPEKYSEWNYWRGRANAFNEAVNTFRLMDNATSSDESDITKEGPMSVEYDYRIIRRVEPYGPLDYVESVGPGGLLNEADYRRALDELKAMWPLGRFELQYQEIKPWVLVDSATYD